MKDIPFYDSIDEIMSSPSKITVIEGCDSVGKSTMISTLVKDLSKRYIVKILRFPDDRGDVKIRSTLFNSDISTHRSASIFLFLADFTHAFEQYVKPYLKDPDTIFIFDRFIPSAAIYQNVTTRYINNAFDCSRLDPMVEAMGDVSYVYMIPTDMESHKARVNKKMGEGDTNCYDPVSDKDIRDKIDSYNKFIESHRTNGILGSRHIAKLRVL